MTHAEAIAILDPILEKLGEHFDAVEILTSWTEAVPGQGSTTRSQPRGTGDWYARQGLAHEFINREQVDDLATAIADKIAPADGGDDWKKAV